MGELEAFGYMLGSFKNGILYLINLFRLTF